MRRLVGGLMGLISVAAFSTPAEAVVVQWADLTNWDQATGTVTGSIDVNGTMVGVTVTTNNVPGAIAFAQTDGTGANYWQPSAPYTSGAVENAPTSTDIIAFNVAGSKTITFSQAVSDVYLALVSWNGNAGTFDQPFNVVSEGCGYWGCGTFGNVTSTSFTGDGELHGVISFTGNFSQTSFTDGTTENWHGIQIGIAGLAPPSAVPEPTTWAMFIGGFGMIGGMMRRRQKVTVRFA